VGVSNEERNQKFPHRLSTLLYALVGAHTPTGGHYQLTGG